MNLRDSHAARVSGLRSLAQGSIPIIGQIVNESTTPSSRAYQEESFNSQALTESIRETRLLLGRNLQVGADGVKVLGEVLEQDKARYAAYAIARLVLEARATIEWLASLQVDTSTRARRTLGLLRQSERDYRTYARAFVLPDFAAEQSGMLAEGNASSEKVDELATRIGGPFPEPEMTSILRRLSWEDDYRLLSGAHGRKWAIDLLRGGRLQAGDEPLHDTYLTLSTASWFASALWSGAVYSLGDGALPVFQARIDPPLNEIELGEERRPWHGIA